jgi:hypothetical protein
MKRRITFALIMSLVTTSIISFVIIALNIGFTDKFVAAWLRSWSVAYVLAVSLMLLVAPRVQILVDNLIKSK